MASQNFSLAKVRRRKQREEVYKAPFHWPEALGLMWGQKGGGVRSKSQQRPIGTRCRAIARPSCSMIGYRPSAAVPRAGRSSPGSWRTVGRACLRLLPASAKTADGAPGLCAQPSRNCCGQQGRAWSAQASRGARGSPHPREAFCGARLTRRTLGSSLHGIARANYFRPLPQKGRRD